MIPGLAWQPAKSKNWIPEKKTTCRRIAISWPLYRPQGLILRRAITGVSGKLSMLYHFMAALPAPRSDPAKDYWCFRKTVDALHCGFMAACTPRCDPAKDYWCFRKTVDALHCDFMAALPQGVILRRTVGVSGKKNVDTLRTHGQ